MVSFGNILIIILIVLILFGAKRIPSIMHDLGVGFKAFKDALDGSGMNINNNTSVKKKIKKNLNIKKNTDKNKKDKKKLTQEKKEISVTVKKKKIKKKSKAKDE